MRTRGHIIMVTAVIALGVAAEGWAHSPAGVPVGTAPLECTTPSGSWKVSAMPGPGGEFPVLVDCGENHAGKSCARYRYDIDDLGGGTPDHVLFAVSADQDLDSAGPSAFVTPPGTSSGDSKTGFLAYARHEYPIRVNPTPNVPADLVIVAPSSPRISTVLVTKGKTRESCLIAGPGVPGLPFRPCPVSRDEIAAGGQCLVRLFYDSSCQVSEIQSLTEGCEVTVGNPIVNGQPLQDNPTSITFGTGTVTCYGPPSPNPARCISK